MNIFMKITLEYDIRKDINLIIESEKIDTSELSSLCNISRTTLIEIKNSNKTTKSVYEKFYSYVYRKKYRLNSVKEELLKEQHQIVLFHGSKNGLSDIYYNGSRKNCDFGCGFYLGQTYNQVLSFVCENENSSVYSFSFDEKNLNIVKLNCDLEWMLVVCYYRGTISLYSNNKKIKDILNKIANADVIIAPIADNKMFYIMSQFTEGEINADVALHSLAASKLGYQYVLKTEKAINNLKPIEKYYLCKDEKEECSNELEKRSYEIDTKLKMAKREFKNGLFIEEIFE